MAGRAVGGVGSGCGAFSLLGLLVSVGLVVWLGSIALDGSTGTRGPSDDGSAPDGIGALADEVDELRDTPGLAGAAQGSVTLDPADGLVPDTTMAVRATGVTPGPVEVSTCLAGEARLPEGLAGCDADLTVSATADGSGAVRLDYAAARQVSIRDIAYDCAAFADACIVVVHPPGAPETGAVAGLTFAEDLPTIDAERPPGG